MDIWGGNMKKLYIFGHSIFISQETQVEANSYEEAEKIFLSGGGDTEEVDSHNGDWECINNPDEKGSDNQFLDDLRRKIYQ